LKGTTSKDSRIEDSKGKIANKDSRIEDSKGKIANGISVLGESHPLES
jgi:hypothetical protein